MQQQRQQQQQQRRRRRQQQQQQHNHKNHQMELKGGASDKKTGKAKRVVRNCCTCAKCYNIIERQRDTPRTAALRRIRRGPMSICEKSHVTRHTPHVTRHTSHVTRHTSHVTGDVLGGERGGCAERRLNRRPPVPSFCQQRFSF